MPTSRLADECRDATERHRRGEAFLEDFCRELFRRALVDHDDGAFEAVFNQYKGMIRAWIRRHPAATSLGEDLDDWTNQTFDRFQKSIGPDRFGLFPGIPALLRYLKTCVNSVLLDEVRDRQRNRHEPLIDSIADTLDATDVERTVLGAQAGRDLWAAICHELGDDSERQVIYLSLIRDLKPREIQRLRPELFDSIADVYRMKRNALDRLRRSPAILRFREPVP